jgi:predicted dehydrogenase
MQKIGCAVIGYGNMGKRHAEYIREYEEGFELRGIWDFREIIRRKILENGYRAYASIEELLADDVQLVVVATQNSEHKPLAIQCLKSGKNVLCEKPAAINADELEMMIDVAKQSGKIFCIHQNRRWDKDYLIVKKTLESGEIGLPVYIENRFQISARHYLTGWRNHRQNGGGMLMDFGSHLFDQVLQLVDSKVIFVDAYLWDLYADGVDDNARVNIRFANGVSALVEMTFHNLIEFPRWHVTATRGTMEMKDVDGNGKIVKFITTGTPTYKQEDIVYNEDGPMNITIDMPEFKVVGLPLPEVYERPPAAKDIYSGVYYKNLYNVLIGTDELLVKPEQSLRAMKLIDIAFQSAHFRRPIGCDI